MSFLSEVSWAFKVICWTVSLRTVVAHAYDITANLWLFVPQPLGTITFKHQCHLMKRTSASFECKFNVLINWSFEDRPAAVTTRVLAF